MIPKELRDRLGLGPGVVDVSADGAALRVEPLATAELEREQGRLLVAASGVALDDEGVRTLRDVDQR